MALPLVTPSSFSNRPHSELSVASCSARAWKLIPSDFPNHLVVTHSNMVCVPLRIRRFLTSSLHWRTCRRCSIDPALFLVSLFPPFPSLSPRDARHACPFPTTPCFSLTASQKDLSSQTHSTLFWTPGDPGRSLFLKHFNPRHRSLGMHADSSGGPDVVGPAVCLLLTASPRFSINSIPLLSFVLFPRRKPHCTVPCCRPSELYPTLHPTPGVTIPFLLTLWRA
jgi:hypothetical protein